MEILKKCQVSFHDETGFCGSIDSFQHEIVNSYFIQNLTKKNLNSVLKKFEDDSVTHFSVDSGNFSLYFTKYTIEL